MLQAKYYQENMVTLYKTSMTPS